jgi:hypothetical protein
MLHISQFVCSSFSSQAIGLNSRAGDRSLELIKGLQDRMVDSAHIVKVLQEFMGPDRRTNFQPGPGPKPGPKPGPVLLLCTVHVHPTKIGS